MALFKVGAAALFESMESDVSSRTIRMTNFPQQWQGLSEAPQGFPALKCVRHSW